MTSMPKSKTYIERRLRGYDSVLSEDEFLRSDGCLVVLASPGAGKTELLNSFAQKLKCSRIRASVFRHTGMKNLAKDALILDGLDEVARLDESSFEATLAKIANSPPKKLILASRAGEWNAPRNEGLIRDFLGLETQTVYIVDLDIHEQRVIFSSQFPQGNFGEFFNSLEELGLEKLLGNPLFLEIFASAQTREKNALQSKLTAFKEAVSFLAEEHNEDLPLGQRPYTDQIVSWANQTFATILLSGAAGISSVAQKSDRMFPFAGSACSVEKKGFKFLFDTQLFKLADKPHFYEPVHRVIAEYGAASYLTNRLNDPNDQLTVLKCLSIIAPNGVVRDELRGMLGWIAALGNEDIQLKAIHADPYAVLSNGDASQLSPNSKQSLLQELSKLSQKDPFFRRSDKFRSFAVKEFFTPDTVNLVQQHLAKTSSDNHLGDLLLELIDQPEFLTLIIPDLESLVKNRNLKLQQRKLALRRLLTLDNWISKKLLLSLIAQGDIESLNLASKIIRELGFSKVGLSECIKLLNALSLLYGKRGQMSRNVGEKYFIKRLAKSFSSTDSELILDRICPAIKCVCNAKHRYQCDCRNGISKIVSMLLDQILENSTPLPDSVRIWEWLRNLNFHSDVAPQDSTSVKILKGDHAIRRSIHSLAFNTLVLEDDISTMRHYLTFSGGCHSGLKMTAEDVRSIVDHAFDNGRPNLWSAFFQVHFDHSENKGIDKLRVHMRSQAHEKPAFMKKWAFHDRGWRVSKKRHPFKRKHWFERRRRAQKRKIETHNREQFEANKKLILAGEHWWWLRQFADWFINNAADCPSYISPNAPEKALAKCIPFLEPQLPTLAELAELKNQGKYSRIVYVLTAAAIAYYRTHGSLNQLSDHVLSVLRTDINLHCPNISDDEVKAFQADLDRSLFRDDPSIRTFAENFIEPQVNCPTAQHPNSSWLNYDVAFSGIKTELAEDWVNRYPNMPITALSDLFDIWVQFGDWEKLTSLIEKRCNEIYKNWPYGPPSKSLNQLRDFWYIRSFFFVKTNNDFVWEELREFDKTIFLIRSFDGPFSSDRKEGRPRLDGPRIYKVLDAFIEKWPKVDLPNHWGTDSPVGEKAYRYIDRLVAGLENLAPEQSMTILSALLSDNRFQDFHNFIKHMKANVERHVALKEFDAPSPNLIEGLLNENRVATVEGLRALLIEELERLQNNLREGVTDPIDVFYYKQDRVDENTARNRIIEFLNPRVVPLDISLTPEDHMASAKRCDITANTSIDGNQTKLVIEVKGQWHRDLYKAAKKQLYDRYAQHPDAAQQGVYLVLWFGGTEKIAGRISKTIDTAKKLKLNIVKKLPEELRGRIDVVVLDLSR